MTLLGKGFFIWQIPKCEGGNPASIAARAKSAGLSHVLIKIADGTFMYNYNRSAGVDYVPPVISSLRSAGIAVWGWHYVRGDNPTGEARIAVDRTRALGLDGYVIDAEAEYKQSGKVAAASRFMRDLRKGLPDLPVALSTYRYPRLHSQIPFDAFLDGCTYAMPQVYFEMAHNPVEQLERSVEQYLGLRYARPVIPTAPAYRRGNWEPTTAELHHFFQRAKEIGITASNAWSWDFAGLPAYNHLWDAVALFDWPASPPVADMPERLHGRLNTHDPEFVGGLYDENAAHVTGDRTLVGRTAIREWYAHFFERILPNAEFAVTGKIGSGTTRHYTWTAAGKRGKILDGNDTLGVVEGRIRFHYSYFNVS